MTKIIFLFYKKLKYFVIILLISLISLHFVIAKADEKPVIASAYSRSSYCDKAYRIKIFENGDVEYLGVHGVNLFGKHKTKISKQAVEKLLKDVNESGFTMEYDKEVKQLANLVQRISQEAVRISQNGKEITYFSDGELMDKIVKATKLERWIGKQNIEECNTIHHPVLQFFSFNWFKKIN